MEKLNSVLLVCMVLCAVFVVISCASTKSSEQKDSVQTDQVDIKSENVKSSLISIDKPVNAADFTLEDAKGEMHTLSDYKGKVLIISFWATWCHACKMEMDFLKKLKRKYEDQGLEVLSINIDSPDEKSVAVSVSRSKRLNFPVLFDSDSSVANQYNPGLQLPYSVIVDRNQRIRNILQGFVPSEEEHIENSVEKLVGE